MSGEGPGGSGRHGDPAAKIAAALERLSHAFRVLLREEGRRRGLSPVQVRVLLHLRRHGPSLRRVGRLAEEFDLAPATVSETVSTLERKKLLRRVPSERDGRVVILSLTGRGESLARELSDWTEVVRRRIASLPQEEKRTHLRFLLRLIASLHDAGVISVARMCVTCRFFGRDGGPDADAPHYCHLLEEPLSVAELRVDCPEHEPGKSAAG